MMTDFGAARPSDLYTAENPVEAGGLEPLEAPEVAALEARIREAQLDLAEAQSELQILLLPQSGETGNGVFSQLMRFCDQVTDAIGRFFTTLFGSKELPVSLHDARVELVTERLELEREHLEELQFVRAELLEVRSRLQELRYSEPEALLPQVQQIRTELSPVTDLLKEFAWTPVQPSEASGTPVIDAFANLSAVPEGFEYRYPAPASPGSWINTPSAEATEIRERVVGDPERDAAYWHKQEGNLTCAIVDQEMILDKLAGDPNATSEFALVQEAVAKGWARYDGASNPAHVGLLLEARGIRTEVVMREDVNRLAQRLAAGEEAIVGVRGEILWNVPSVQSGSDLNPANHAIWVTGATVVERDGKTEVVSLHINDSGDPNGRGREVPVELFLRAWSTSDNHTIYAIPGQR